MREQNRLGALQMGVAGDDNFAIRFGEVNQRALKFPDQLASRIDFASQKEPQVGRNLIVAAAARV